MDGGSYCWGMDDAAWLGNIGIPSSCFWSLSACRMSIRAADAVGLLHAPVASKRGRLRCFCQDDIEAGDRSTGAESSKENKQPGRKRATQDRVFLSLLQMFFFPFIFHSIFAKKKEKEKQRPTPNASDLQRRAKTPPELFHSIDSPFPPGEAVRAVPVCLAYADEMGPTTSTKYMYLSL